MNNDLNRKIERVGSGSESEEISVRELLGAFGAQRRGYTIVGAIRERLSKHGVTTEPDFNDDAIGIDDRVFLIKADKKSHHRTTAAKPGQPADTSTEEIAEIKIKSLVLHRLPIARKEIKYVPPDAAFGEVITLMTFNRFSQIPVMQSAHIVKGVVSWESIGRVFASGSKPTKASECMKTQVPTILDNETVFRAMNEIIEHDYVLIQDHNDKRFSGILTATDLGQLFKDLAEPFLLLSEIENGLRAVVHGKFMKTDYQSACSEADQSRKDSVSSAEHLTLGELLRLIESPANWEKLRIAVDRKTLIAELNTTRQTRNDVMHFHPDGIDPVRVDQLRKMHRFLLELVK